MFDIIVNPFITALVFFYSMFGDSIVIAIALLTVIIRLATSPLLLQQQRSTRAMQEIQPELTKLRDKYKNDREKLAQAQMALYKENGINPLGGCLPLIIQLPILLALYRAINHALGSTPFEVIDLSERLIFGTVDSSVPLNNMWIGMDLTLAPTANPAYALMLPVLVMITTWMQSKLTMPTPKPSENEKENQTAQITRTMTTVMPLMFGFFALSFSVGISIYFVVSNSVGIVQSTLMGKAEWGRLFGREPEETPALATAGANGGSSSGGNGGKVTKVTRSKEKQSAEKAKPTTLADTPAPTRSSNRKNKKMKKASGKAK